LIAQIDNAIDIFEGRTKGLATGLFIFDNAPSHQKRADDALSARKMPKNPSPNWTHRKGGARMRSTVLPGNGETQFFYFDDDHPTMPGWFKGMEEIIHERGLWRDGLLAQCEGFKCIQGKTDCCCRRLLFTQPDFVGQKSRLEEFITSWSHICDFYPKYHCELNFIEKFWGAAKFRYRNTSKTYNINEMEKNVIACLDDIPLLQIRR
jgi:transposase